MTRVIDAWSQQPNELFMRQPWLRPLLRWTRQEDLPALPIDVTLKAMDDAGVEKSLLCAWVGPHGALIDNDETAAHVRAHPDLSLIHI